MYKEYPISKELEESSWNDNLFIDFTPVSSDPEHSVVLCVVCAKDGKRVVRGGEVFGGGQGSPFLQAMENAKAAALSAFYGKELPNLNNGKKVPTEQTASKPAGNLADTQTPSGRTASQTRNRAASEGNLVNRTEPAAGTTNVPAAGQTESSTTGRQTTASANRQTAPSTNRQSAGPANRQSAASANRQTAPSANRQSAASPGQQSSPPSQQPAGSVNPQTAPAAEAGMDTRPGSGVTGMSGDDDFRVIIGPYAKKENNYISWIVQNDLDFVRRICNLRDPLPTYAETIKKIKEYVKNHGIAL